MLSVPCVSRETFSPGIAELPPMLVGELALVLDAGAYGMSLASNYNTRARPAEVLVEKGIGRLIRRRETLDDLLATEFVPGG